MTHLNSVVAAEERLRYIEQVRISTEASAELARRMQEAGNFSALQRMREQAHVIQGEVARLMDDLTRLDDRVRKLHGHFTAAQKDVDLILTSTEKLTRRGARIGDLEFETVSELSQPKEKAAESRTGQLRLRVVDED